ncbi:hypothetical protein ACFPL7_21440 [Dongia soli]|uniref:DUF4190 domain-containing protein n=1 Tax=Dongia soli TaxID=600628 RepID=A0ABU5E976_9PROT|nr:hypothetical protein [Dongia soli]MDY0882155.1 hypothetical protein [Dongia soli]
MTQDSLEHPTSQAASLSGPGNLPAQPGKSAPQRLPDAAFAGEITDRDVIDHEGAPIEDRGAFRRYMPFKPPVAGALSVIFAIAAFYRTTILLAPLALIAGIVALCRRQYNWGLIGIIAAVAALLTDITFWSLVGAAWMVRWLVWS